MSTQDDILIIDNISADTLVADDQIIVDGELFIIHSVDTDRPDIDEVLIKGENLSGGDNEIALFADDYFDVWSM